MATVIKRRSIRGLVIATVVLGVATILFSALFVMERVQGGALSSNLELVYQRSFYDLTDHVNSLDMKLAKLLASSSGTYQSKLLKEISTNASFAEQNMSVLPLENSDLNEIHKFLNQVAGYTESLSVNNTSGVSSEDRATLNKIRQIVGELKNGLNQISLEVQKGFKIVDNLNKLKDNTTGFSSIMGEMKVQDVEFPTMIFDGPFSEAQLKKEPQGLSGGAITQAEAELAVVSILALEQPFEITFMEKAEGTFVTYDFKVEKNNIVRFLSISEIGGKLITMSGQTASNNQNYSLQDAKRISLEFIDRLGIEHAEVVWDDEINSDIYLNIAPVINNVIIYPDLIKVKVDLSTGVIIGYEATSYYMNHKNRSIAAPSFDAAAARSQIAGLGFSVLNTKLCLAPIEYRDEVFCYQFEAQKNGETYYFFINAITGDEEEILKVVQANDATLLS